MRLNVGDEIVCVCPMEHLTYGKIYRIESIRDYILEDDICIFDDIDMRWWFGQIGSSEPWTRWFVLKKDWDRDQKILKILN